MMSVSFAIEAGGGAGVGPEQYVAAKSFAHFDIDTEPCYSRFSCPFFGSKEIDLECLR